MEICGILRLDILKDVLDDWMKQEPDDSSISNAAMIRRIDATRLETALYA